MLRLLLIALSLLIVGCPTTRSSGDDDDSGSGDDDDATGTIEPAEGIWLLTLTEVGTDDCSLLTGAAAGDSLGSTTLALVKTADEDFTLTDGDDQTFHCMWGDDNSFVCDADVWTDSISALFPDATLIRNGSRTGTFDSPTSATTTNINVNTCEGAECGLAEDAGGYQFPCTFGFDATMTR
jgi:hypothetical protein